jgi:hypothetical protein
MREFEFVRVSDKLSSSMHPDNNSKTIFLNPKTKIRKNLFEVLELNEMICSMFTLLKALITQIESQKTLLYIRI